MTSAGEPDLAAARSALQERGHAVLRSALPGPELRDCLARLAAIAKREGVTELFAPSPRIANETREAIRVQMNYRGGLDALRHSQALRKLAGALLAGDVEVFPVWKFRMNVPGEPASWHPWHQDEWTWPDQRGREIVTLWIALSPVDRRNGIELLDRSLSGRLLTHDRNDYQASIVDASIVERGPIVAPTLDPGDAVVFDAFTLHRTVPNTTDRVRASLDLRFQRKTVGSPPGESPTAVRT